MSQRICFTLPTSGQRICVDIPLLIHPWRDPNFPDPPDPLKGLHPEQWLHGVEINPQLARDVSALASMHALSASMTFSVGSKLQEAIRSQIESLRLPEGVQVHLEVSNKAA